jgi:two-component system sensor histidine kinase ChiS
MTSDNSRFVILNVDDRPESLYLKDRLLRESGYTVANATTGKSALDLANRLRPALILLDVHLPDIDGREVCRRLKEDPVLKAIPVILVSATLKGHAANLDGLRWASADGYIAEPFEPDALASTLRNVLKTM